MNSSQQNKYADDLMQCVLMSQRWGEIYKYTLTIWYKDMMSGIDHVICIWLYRLSWARIWSQCFLAKLLEILPGRKAHTSVWASWILQALRWVRDNLYRSTEWWYSVKRTQASGSMQWMVGSSLTTCLQVPWLLVHVM